MSDSYRLTIDVEAGDKRGLELLLRLQELGLSWRIERLPSKALSLVDLGLDGDGPEQPLSEAELRPYRRAGGEPLEVPNAACPPEPDHYEPRSHE